MYGFGYSRFHCKTVEICNWFGASYETINGCAKVLPLQDLQNAEPHFYIRFPSHVTNTTEAARIRTKGINSSYKRLFTVVHLTDVHGDMDSAHAAYEYADLIDADFAALTGDFVPTNYMDEDPITDIVDAYNKREKFTSHYIGNLKEDKETVTVSFDFSNRPDSEFVAYFTGHIHADAVGYARNTKTRQAVLCSLCTTAVKGSAEYHSFALTSTPRDYGTDSQIALNVFAFDFHKKSIYVARVGNKVFKDREKTWMELSYS